MNWKDVSIEINGKKIKLPFSPLEYKDDFPKELEEKRVSVLNIEVSQLPCPLEKGQVIDFDNFNINGCSSFKILEVLPPTETNISLKVLHLVK